MATSIPTRFPFISLRKALDRAKAIYDADRNGKGLGIPSAFSAWGYSPKSSGGFQNVGALIAYGLMDDEGSSADRRVRLSEDARRYFGSEIDEDQARLRSAFAIRPKLFAHLAQHWGDSVPPDHVARTYLRTEVGLSDQSARSALGIYKDNLAFVDHAVGGGEPEQAALDDSQGSGAETFTSRVSEQFLAPNPTVQGGRRVEHTENQITQSNLNQPQILLAGGLLQISATVDREGITKLKALLDKYDEILGLLED